MSGTLFVVATPIGNLEDVTLRALRVLRSVELIAAEDTRRTARLLAHHGLSTPTLSFHEHNTRRRIPQLVARLLKGSSIALVTDAGTPGVSDPGIELVQACATAGVQIDPVPGASAPLTAAVASGFPLVPLTLFGFAPSKAKDRMAWLQQISGISNTLTFFEAPHRIARTMLEASSVLGNRQIVVGRELTKLHQEFMRGTATELVERLQTPRGEFTIVVGPIQPIETVTDTVNEDTIVAEFCRITESGDMPRRRAINTLAAKYRMPSRQVYAMVERAKNVSYDQ
jgi:16S rRNA (cytidine1402-2'-O)-methyltransferase